MGRAGSGKVPGEIEFLDIPCCILRQGYFLALFFSEKIRLTTYVTIFYRGKMSPLSPGKVREKIKYKEENKKNGK